MTTIKRVDDIRKTNKSLPSRPKKTATPKLALLKRPARIAKSLKLSSLKSVARRMWHNKTKLILLALLFAIGSTISYLLIDPGKKKSKAGHEPTRAEQIQQIVITDDTKLVTDFMFNLKMVINNQPQAIPANYGKTEDQRLIFNTDASTGDIHVQSPKREDYNLSDFFALWGSQFNSNCLLNHCLSEEGSLTITVNGKINSEYDKYIIKPDDRIVIIYNDQL